MKANVHIVIQKRFERESQNYNFVCMCVLYDHHIKWRALYVIYHQYKSIYKKRFRKGLCCREIRLKPLIVVKGLRRRGVVLCALHGHTTLICMLYGIGGGSTRLVRRPDMHKEIVRFRERGFCVFIKNNKRIK